MIKSKKQISFIFIKKQNYSSFPITEQTSKIRNRTNMKIRELGPKYYNVKEILERMRIQRDVLFNVGKELEMQFKVQKKGLHLQTQCKRMKESLICWYCENFYQEILDPNSIIIKKLLISQIKKQNIFCNKSSTISKKNSISNKADEAEEIPVPIIEINTFKKDKENVSILNNAKMNQEIDQFEFSNINQLTHGVNEALTPHLMNNFADVNDYFLK